MGTNSSTDALMKMLEASPVSFLKNFVEKNKNINDDSFNEYLKSFMEKKKIRMSTLIKKANISKTYAYQCLNGERLPGRDIVIRMCFVLGLTPKQSNRLLTLAQKNILYPKHRRDALILYCISKKMDLDKANEFLEQRGELSLL